MTARRKARWLEVGLRRIDTQPIKEALASEYARRDGPGWHAKDMPVSVIADGSLRVALLHPNAVIERLRMLYSIGASEESAMADFDAMSQAEKEDHIRSLVRAGETMSAIIAARQAHGLDLSAAKQMVETLRAQSQGAKTGDT